MRKIVVAVLLALTMGFATAHAEGPKDDVFKGKLFAPKLILEHQGELQLSKQQFTAIRKAVVEVQSNVAEHEWDMQEAYQALMTELDQTPIDESKVLEQADKALLAENQVKKKQMAMLVRLRNLLTVEQVDYLAALSTAK